MMNMSYASNEMSKSAFTHKTIPMSNCTITYSQAIRVKGNQRRSRIRSQNTQQSPCTKLRKQHSSHTNARLKTSRTSSCKVVIQHGFTNVLSELQDTKLSRIGMTLYSRASKKPSQIQCFPSIIPRLPKPKLRAYICMDVQSFQQSTPPQNSN